MVNFYKSRQWKSKREVILKRDEYLCRECKRYGKTTPAVTVHHILPLEPYFEYRLMNWNLISICNKCHEGMHNRLADELSDIGKQWAERIKQYIK